MSKTKTANATVKNGKTPSSRLTRASIAKMATVALEKYKYPDLGADLFVKPEEFYKREEWWFVPVHTTKELPRRFPFYDVLAEAEEELQQDNRKIQLIPG